MLLNLMPPLRLALCVLACLALSATQSLRAQETESPVGDAAATSESEAANPEVADADEMEAGEPTEESPAEEAGDDAEGEAEEHDASEAEAADHHDDEAAHDDGGHSAADHAEGGHGGEHHDMGHGNAHDSLFDPSELAGELAVYSLVVFLVLMALLSKFAWPKIAAALDARDRAISDNIAAAQEKHDQAAALLAEHQAKINAAAEEVRQMLEEARRDAEATKGQIVTEAREAADAERQRALRDIENAKDGAVKGLAEQSAALAVDLASRVVRQEISQERQSEIVREALGLMGTGANN